MRLNTLEKVQGQAHFLLGYSYYTLFETSGGMRLVARLTVTYLIKLTGNGQSPYSQW